MGTIVRWSLLVGVLAVAWAYVETQSIPLTVVRLISLPVAAVKLATGTSVAAGHPACSVKAASLYTLTKAFFGLVVKESDSFLEEARKQPQGMGTTSRVHVQLVPYSNSADGHTLHGQWIYSARRPLEGQAFPPSRPMRVYMHVHGGAHIIGNATADARSVEEVVVALGGDVAVFNVNYRKLPEHSAGTQLGDVMAAYKLLLDQGIPAHRIILGGCSAGASLSMRLPPLLAQRGLPRPAALFLQSPMSLTDGKTSFDDYPRAAERAQTDVMPPALFNMVGKTVPPAAFQEFAITSLPKEQLRGNYPPTLVLASAVEVGQASMVVNARHLREHAQAEVTERYSSCLHHCPLVAMGPVSFLLLGAPEALAEFHFAMGWMTAQWQRAAREE